MMRPNDLGPEQTTGEDRAYRGSRFSEVRSAIFANPYQRPWGAEGTPPLPTYDVTFMEIVRSIYRATVRTLDSSADLRWGPNGKGFRRLIHANGVCLTGTWEITEETGYSGYFAKGSKALLIGRYSTAGVQTRRGGTRSLALVGKLWPTTDPNHEEPLRTAGFITQQDLGGDNTWFINDAELRNAPDSHVLRRGFVGALELFIESVTFLVADTQPTQRQLYLIAELGKPAGEPTRAPAFMRLLCAPGQPRIEGSAPLDLRDEVMAHIFDKGDPTPKRRLVFDIEVTDEGVTHGTPLRQHRTFGAFRPIGKITFDDAVISYNGDFVIHFHHPSWRADRNDPCTATRRNEHKVRF